MSGPGIVRTARRFIALAVAVAALSALVRLASDEGPDGERVPYSQTVAAVGLVAVTGWALLAARSAIRRQEPAQIELLPPQPGDTEATGRSGSPPAGVGALSDGEFLAFAPGELHWLRKRVAAGITSREAYDERLAPILRDLAEARAASAGRRIDVEAIVDIGPHLPDDDPIAPLLMRIPAYRRRALTRAIGAVITKIEEID